MYVSIPMSIMCTHGRSFDSNFYIDINTMQTLVDSIAPEKEVTDTADVATQKHQVVDDRVHSSYDPESGRESTPQDTKQPRQQRAPKNPAGKLDKPIRVYKLLTDTQFRWRHSIRSSVLWSISMIIVGIVFLCLSATGVYPDSIDVQKEIGVYAEDIVKYTLYIVAGILAILAAFIVNRTEESTNSPPKLLIPKLLLITSTAMALATIGMSIQILVDVNNASGGQVAWWSWLILALIILQRLFFSCACGAAVWTLMDVSKFEECKSIVLSHP
jgi:hypothetical protein